MGLLLSMLRVEGYYLLFTLIFRLLKAVSPRIKGFLYWISRKGAFIHESLHFLMMRLLCIPVKLSDVHVDYKGNGSVRIPPGTRKTFLKFLLIGFAPLIGGTILLLEIQSKYFGSLTGLFGMIARILIILSIVISVSPSLTDLSQIWRAILSNSRIFVRQMLVLGAAFGIYIANHGWLSRYETLLDYMYEPAVILGIYLVIDGVRVIGLMGYRALANRRFNSKNFQPSAMKITKSDRKAALVDHAGLSKDYYGKSIRKIKKAIKEQKNYAPSDLNTKDKIRVTIKEVGMNKGQTEEINAGESEWNYTENQMSKEEIKELRLHIERYL